MSLDISRFTDRTRKVITLSRQIARETMYEYVIPEHLLWGLIKEGSGVACNVLKNLDINLQQIVVNIPISPDKLITIQPVYGVEVENICNQAIIESKSLNHNYVGTEHLLLAMLRISKVAFGCLNVTSEEVEEEIKNILGINNKNEEILKFCDKLITDVNNLKQLIIRERSKR